ncbi:MAG: hypothetical protein AB1894_19385 [Chloroflexota bacterium]
MPTFFKRFANTLVVLVLLFGLGGLLLVFSIVASDLPSGVYTSAQREYLDYNSRLKIYQEAPTWNLVLPGGEAVPAALTGWQSTVRANLDARYEEQEGVSATLYDLEFNSQYHFIYPGPAITTTVELYFPFPSNLETLHQVEFLVDGQEPEGVVFTVNGITWRAELQAQEEHDIAISYRADGASSFSYALSRDRRSDVDIVFTVNGLTGSQLPKSSLAASQTTAAAEGETFAWQYPGLIPNRDIQLDLPARQTTAQKVAKLQGRFVSLAGAAPFWIGLCLLSLAGWLRLEQMPLRLEAYLLLGLCLALFYPALVFLSGLLGLEAASALAWLGVSALVIAFLGLAAGFRPTWWRAAWLLFIFLGVLSLGGFTPWRGLTLTLGGLLWVGTLMLVYARRGRALAVPPPPVESASPEISAALSVETPTTAKEQPSQQDFVSAAAPTPAPLPLEPERHCPRCGRRLEEAFKFCPACGYDAHGLRRCPHCSHEQHLLPGLQPIYCLHCGKPLPGDTGEVLEK